MKNGHNRRAEQRVCRHPRDKERRELVNVTGERWLKTTCGLCGETLAGERVDLRRGGDEDEGGGE